MVYPDAAEIEVYNGKIVGRNSQVAYVVMMHPLYRNVSTQELLDPHVSTLKFPCRYDPITNDFIYYYYPEGEDLTANDWEIRN